MRTYLLALALILQLFSNGADAKNNPYLNVVQMEQELVLISAVANKPVTVGQITLQGDTFKPNHNITEPIGTFSVGNRLQKDVELVMERDKDKDYNQVHNNELFEIRDNKLYLKSDEGLSVEENVTYVIRVNIVGGDAGNDQYFNVYKTTDRPSGPIKIINAFSPNGDDKNDTWVVPDLSLYGVVQIEVYDRAGNRLFYTKDPKEGWDGRNKSGQVVPGAYFYVIHIDYKHTLRGVVTVLNSKK